MTISKDGDDPRFRWVRAHPMLGKVIAGTSIIGILAGAVFFVWRDLSQGRVLKVLIIGGMAIFGGWRTYRNAKKAARS